MHDDTLMVHVGRDPERQGGMVNAPVYHGSTVLQTSTKLQGNSSAIEAREMVTR